MGIIYQTSQTPRYSGLFLTRIDGSGRLALTNIRRAISSGVALILGMGVEGRPGLRLGLGFFAFIYTPLV